MVLYIENINMLKNPFHLISILFALLIIVLPLRSQELDPTVDVNLQNMSNDAKDRLANFKQDVTDYLTRTRFTDEDIVNDVRGKPYKIKCNFQFFLTASTGFDTYEAQVVIIAQRNIFKTQNFSTILRIKDDNWGFNYTRGQGLYHDDQRFNTLSSFLDYYAYLIIGSDDDSWESLLGNKRFQKAQDVVNQAVASGNTKGWTDITSTKATRSSYPQELLNTRYDSYRKGFWLYHFAGIDSIQYDKHQALERIAQAIDLIGKTKKTEVRSFSIKAFFDAKYLEIAQVLVDYYDKMIYRRLGEIDPDHVSTYDEYRLK
jgi:hypothetical protein